MIRALQNRLDPVRRRQQLVRSLRWFSPADCWPARWRRGARRSCALARDRIDHGGAGRGGRGGRSPGGFCAVADGAARSALWRGPWMIAIG